MRATPRAVPLLLVLMLAPAALAAQRDTVTVVAGEEYRAGAMKEALLGRDYRQVWTAPVRVAVLDLGTFAGGLTPTETGGGNQTLSLRFRGADGREYAFRSVNKEQGRGAHEDLRGTLVESLLQDQVSSQFPAGPLAADRLAEAAGILRIPPALYVMPDDPRLGEFREEFAGILGMMEERPSQGNTGVPGLERAAAIEGTEEMLEALAEGPRHRVDTADYLAGRLVDMLLGDWDRHGDQYRWARFDVSGGHLWRAVPRDRDYVFVDYDGLLLGVLRSRVPNALAYKPDFRGQLRGLTANSEPLDRRLLGSLTRAQWDSVANVVQARLTDAVIDDAVRRLPPEDARAAGAELAANLRARRDRLDEVSAAFYELVFRAAEAHGKEGGDFALVQRLAGGGVEVRLHAGGEDGPVYFLRRYAPAETREVRVFLHGGADRARVTGGGPADVVVRVIGGAGDDHLADQTAGGRKVAFYDDDGTNRFDPRPGTRVDERPYEEPGLFMGGETEKPRRESGVTSSLLSPAFAWKVQAGPALGAGPSRTRYGFRYRPYAVRQHLYALWAPLHTRFGVEYVLDRRYPGALDRFGVTARASDLEATGFHGWGNDTPEEDADDARVWERQLAFEPTYAFVPSEGTEFLLGAQARWSDPEVEAGTPADLVRPPGTAAFTVAGARAGLRLLRRGETTVPTNGWTLAVDAAGYPLVMDDSPDEAGIFADARALATGYLTPVGGGPTVALRAGGQRVWGDFPVQYAAFLGGSPTLRGHRPQRFAGDAALHGSAELRQPLFRTELVVKGTLGAFALADAGRVWYGGDSEGGWHTAVGGGLFFTFLDRARTVSVSYARGERGIVYLALGVPY